MPKESKRKTKAKKTGPKRALSAYMFFAKEERPKIKEEHPDMAFGEIGREIGKRWNELEADAKEPFKNLAANDKVRYEREKAAAAAAAADADEDED